MKILVVRFSSIGDIVLTTPVLRGLNTQLKDVEIHYLTKDVFKQVIEHNPHVIKVHTINKSISEILPELKKENYDWIIDLHNNIRTKSLKLKLRRPSKKFPKLHWQKWKLVKFKRNDMPNLHIVDRYFEAVAHLGVKPDNKKCEFPIPESEEVAIEGYGLAGKNYCSVVIGAKFKTKQLPLEKLLEVIEGIELPVVLIGGPNDHAIGEEIREKSSRSDVHNTCGIHSIVGSASLLKQSAKVLTNDTGMMHIASCYDLPIVSVWGNTVPALGMYPYRPETPTSYSIHQVQNLKCRPCSKIGYEKCPKGHFDCMMKQNTTEIVKDLNA
ncbi:MAG: ADP-heptose:LPS heptosyltransferase [Crocinitomicaceae bacterium]